MKISTAELGFLNIVVAHTELTPSVINRGELNSWSNYTPKLKSLKKQAETLQEKGLISLRWGNAELTADGWTALGLNPYQLYLSKLYQGLQDALLQERHSKEMDKPSYSPWTVETYRELYKNPDMTAEEVAGLERERVRGNRIIGEQAIQWEERYIAKWEFYASINGQNKETAK